MVKEPNRSVTVSSGKIMLCIGRESEEEPARGGRATVFLTASELKQRRIRFKFNESRGAIICNDPEGYRLVSTEKL